MKISINGIDTVIQQVSSGVFRRAMSSAMNKAIKQTSVYGSRVVRETYNLPSKTIKEAMDIDKATPKTLSASLSISGQRMPLIDFKARQIKKGVAVRISKDSGRQLIPSAFITKAKYSEAVFVRQKDGAKRVGRGPIKALTGPSVPMLMNSKKVMDKMLENYRNIFPGIFSHELEYYITKYAEA